jgi:polysaccharide export outer membrane protein
MWDGMAGLKLCGLVPVLVAGALVGGCARPAADMPRGQAAYAIMPAPVGDTVRDYKIGPLDTISITVFQEPDLTLQNVQVDAGGNILLPLIGGVQAAGKNTVELSRLIADKLRLNYLVNPQVSVIVSASVSQKVTVDGSVTQPGVYAIQGRTTLVDAVAMARGTTRVAKLDQVIVFREIAGRPAVARFNLSDIRMGKQPNPEVLGNDLVVVGFSNVKGVYRDFMAAAPLTASFIYAIGR